MVDILNSKPNKDARLQEDDEGQEIRIAAGMPPRSQDPPNYESSPATVNIEWFYIVATFESLVKKKSLDGGVWDLPN